MRLTSSSVWGGCAEKGMCKCRLRTEAGGEPRKRCRLNRFEVHKGKLLVYCSPVGIRLCSQVKPMTHTDIAHIKRNKTHIC